MKNLQLSSVGQHYWYGDGASQTEFDRLTKKFMRPSGRSENLVGEVIRAINRLYYEYCNNENCNAVQSEEIPGEWVTCRSCRGTGYRDDYEGEELICYDCDGEGGWYEDSDYNYYISPFYDNFLKIIRYYFKEYCRGDSNQENAIDAIDNLEGMIADLAYSINFDDECMVRYDRVVDYIVWFVSNDEDNQAPIPDFYNND